MTWDEDTLEYGYVVDRVDGGGWWHLHFGRSTCSYLCDLLGCRTDILACIQRYAVGGVTTSPRFHLTLDGEGVEPFDSRLDFRWGDKPVDPDLAEMATRFQREVMPLLVASSAFQQAAAEVVGCQRHLVVVAPGKLHRLDVGPPPSS